MDTPILKVALPGPFAESLDYKLLNPPTHELQAGLRLLVPMRKKKQRWVFSQVLPHIPNSMLKK